MTGSSAAADAGEALAAGEAPGPVTATVAPVPEPAPAPEPLVAPPAGGCPLPGADGLLRCPWALSTPEYVEYHDTEWGRPVRDSVALFERVSLEAFQSGLSWLTILRKRPAFRAAFAGFDPVAVAAFDEARVQALLADAGIVRNRRKIEATIANARALLALTEPLADVVWSFVPPARPAPVTLADVPAVTPESKALAKALRARGFVFIGPTTAYALMQACGLVDDHLAGCVARGGETVR